MTYKEASSRSYGQLIMTIVGSFTVISGVVLVIFWPRIFDNILFKVRIFENRETTEITQ